MKKILDKYGKKSNKIEKIDIWNLEKEVNLNQIRNELKRRVYYKDIYRDSKNFYDFKLNISVKCRDLILDALDKIELYIENNVEYGSEIYNHSCLYAEKILTEQIFIPIWDGFIAEEYNIDLFSKMGIEVYTFTNYEKERLFDDDYSIDHMIYLNDGWVGVQSKCITFRNISIEAKKYYYNKHKKCLNERKNIKNIYYIFYAKDESHIKYKDVYNQIEGTALDGFLIPYDEVFNLDKYTLKGVDYQSLLSTEEEEDLEDLPF